MLRVVKDTERHEVYALTGELLIKGDFSGAYKRADNSNILPTETQKNTLYALSKKYQISPLERWVCYVAKDVMDRHKHITSVHLHLDQDPWERIVVDGKKHNHAFKQGSTGTRFVTLEQERNGKPHITAGFRDLKVMKTTQSGFEGFIKDKYTTLQPSRDRVMATKVYCEWNYMEGMGSIDYNHVFDEVQRITLEYFAGDPVKGDYSSSVQATLYKIGQKVLSLFPSVSNISFKLPNIHYYAINFNEFDTTMTNNNEVFNTFDGARGQIEATVQRTRSKL